MPVAIVTGSNGLVGSQACAFFAARGFDVAGIDNDLRKFFFGPDASTLPNRKQLLKNYKNYRHYSVDIRNAAKVEAVFKKYGPEAVLVVHAASQPSHDWAAKDPLTDFAVNASATLNLLEACRKYCPQAVFIFTSTNKVYGDAPNRLPFIEQEKRFELPAQHRYFEGIDESMGIDASLHSVFGASKLAADIMTQEYGRYFGLKTGVFRCGCITGPASRGAMMHGFLSFLVKCAFRGDKYKIFGYKGKQVRDNLHAQDLVNAFYHFFQAPRPGEFYNLGGARFANVSVLEAIQICSELTGRQLAHEYVDQARAGDHIWWVSDTSKFNRHYPQWKQEYGIRETMRQILEAQQG